MASNQIIRFHFLFPKKLLFHQIEHLFHGNSKLRPEPALPECSTYLFYDGKLDVNNRD